MGIHLQMCPVCFQASIVGSVVECSPATRAARVRFPDDANLFLPYSQPAFSTSSTRVQGTLLGVSWSENAKKVLETRGIDPRTSHMLSERSTI